MHIIIVATCKCNIEINYSFESDLFSQFIMFYTKILLESPIMLLKFFTVGILKIYNKEQYVVFNVGKIATIIYQLFGFQCFILWILNDLQSH